MWMYLGVISACFLGLYDVSRKHALQNNAAMPVLFVSCLCSALIAAAAVILSRTSNDFMTACALYIAPVSPVAHLHLFIKSVIVSASWIFAYFAMKHLPISIASPVGATCPLWTVLAAIIFFGEHLTIAQYIGITLMLGSYFWLSAVGGKEGIKFHANIWIFFVLFSAVLGAASGIYDKYLIQTLLYPPLAVQAWFLIYLVPVLAVVMLFWFKNRASDSLFSWRWTIPLIAIMLIFADILYFRAISHPGSLISILSTVRASCVLISFLIGGIIFSEHRLKSKALAVGGIIIGTCCMFFPA
jgi:transporter family protein